MAMTFLTKMKSFWHLLNLIMKQKDKYGFTNYSGFSLLKKLSQKRLF